MYTKEELIKTIPYIKCTSVKQREQISNVLKIMGINEESTIAVDMENVIPLVLSIYKEGVFKKVYEPNKGYTVIKAEDFLEYYTGQKNKADAEIIDLAFSKDIPGIVVENKTGFIVLTGVHGDGPIKRIAIKADTITSVEELVNCSSVYFLDEAIDVTESLETILQAIAECK